MKRALLMLVVGASAAAAGALEEAPPARTSALRTIEGQIVEIGQAEAEGGLPVTILRIEDRSGVSEVLLAPPASLEEMGFEAIVGDRVRAKVFVDEGSQRSYAQKVLNRDRGLMVRLRTLNRLPLWDARGSWQGARQRTHETRRAQRRPVRRPATRRPARRPRVRTPNR